MTGKNANNGKGNTSRLLGGIEGGGTRFNCAIGPSPDEIWARNSFPTTAPEETFARVVEFFKEGEAEYGALSAIGVASFGPVDLQQQSGYYGHITTTPKPHWRYTDVVGHLKRMWDIPVAFDTDVNGAARGEGAFGAARGLDNFVYVTVGTGIGAGIVAHGRPLNGAMHPEVGHMRLPRAAEDLHFPGCCQYHGDCLEGLASGPAIEARWGQKGETLPADHPAWTMQAEYLSMLCMNLTLCYAPERIILGGGVMARRQLLPMIRERFAALMNGYTELSAVSPQDYIVPPSLGERSGEVGALVAAERLAG
ncbi:ROK family protein [Microbulbifer halophilus]|uniref:fructokinase n=1 Tax=Microbulbifer halophilus TaxID=453963 RepID=A0ABW5EC67_9GAMM|nr:ROK family protein [Microbulbifer halophilus]MCW8126589.1 ROK family protein [Microbulbifer halophilus]